MYICDMHCDTLTACADSGADLLSNSLQLDLKRFKAAGGLAQCFAIFTRGQNEQAFYSYADFFACQMQKHADICARVENLAGLKAAKIQGKSGAILTAENLGFMRSPSGVERLYNSGVRMASLVWNDENALAYPNLIFKGGLPDFSARENRGLTKLGFEVAKELQRRGIIIDISHLSDGGVGDILSIAKKPIVASHSNAYALAPVSRNLTDEQIKGVANTGGIVGVNYCLDFLGGENALTSAAAHIKHIINVGGEDCAALGGDLDGMPVQRGMEDCSRVATLCERLSDELGSRLAQKVCAQNFVRVFGEVCG